MAGTFPPNDLSNGSRYWSRDVEKRLINIEDSFSSAEINNVTRDSQILTTANQALAAALDAQTVLNGLVGLGSTGSEYTINASNINAGTIDASTVNVTNINASNIESGTLTGITVQTGTSGRRAVMSGTNISFYDEGGTFTGSISGSGATRSSAVQIVSNTSSGVYAYNGGADLVGPGTTISAGNNGNSSAAITSSRLDVSGDIYNPDTYANTTTAATNMFVSTGGLFMRTTTTSSREAKEQIELLNFDLEAFLSVQPVSFKYKDGIITDPATKDQTQIGFIAEDFVDAGFESELVKQPEGDEQYIGLRYDKMYMFLHKVVAEQQKIIKDLTDRIESLEAK